MRVETRAGAQGQGLRHSTGCAMRCSLLSIILNRNDKKIKATIKKVTEVQILVLGAFKVDATERVGGGDAEKREHVDREDSLKTKTSIDVTDNMKLKYFCDEIISKRCTRV